jgi:hypothetical protein
MTMVSSAGSGRRDFDAHLHSAPLPQGDRCARGRQRGDGLPARRLAGFCAGRARPRQPPHAAIEHPTGEMTVVATLDDTGGVRSAAILRTARKLMDGTVFA